jgi:hypothetical protein
MSNIITNTDTVAGTIVNAQGEVVSKPTVLLSQEEAELLRKYKKFLHKRGLREALYCNTCFNGSLSDGMDAFVTDGQIMFKCHHRMLYYHGTSY